jgi:4-hydroxy-2-oxoheptanedioate aldolase
MTLNERLQKKEFLLGLCVMYPAPGIIERIGSDWDWVWIDAQHGQHDYNSILGCVRACDLVKTPSIVRVPSHDYGAIGLALDAGASGVMVPMVNTGREASLVAKAAKFPPLGSRSFGGRRPIDLYGRTYAHTANIETLLIAQIETEEGLANVDEIASVPGVDVVFFGPDDMALQLSMPMDQERKIDFFAIIMEKIALAAANAGKIVGTVTASAEMINIATQMGYQLCVGTSDVALLAGGSKRTRETFADVVE